MSSRFGAGPRRPVATLAAITVVCLIPSLTGSARVHVDTRSADGMVLNEGQILTAYHVDEPQWYENNIPFVETPDSTIDQVYYYRWSTYKRAQRYTAPGSGYISTEYDVPIWYARSPYSALPDAAGYHLLDGRWLRDRRYAGDYLDFWLRGAGTAGVRSFSEWIIDAAYQRYLVTGDAARLIDYLPQFVQLYGKWDRNYTSGEGLYFQSPLSDATEYTETSMHSRNWFSGGAGYRPTINAYMYAAAKAISAVASMAGDTATAGRFAARAAALKSAVQSKLWDPQRHFFMEVYNDDRSNRGLAGTRTTWRELMGYAPWAFDLPDPGYAVAWRYLLDPQRFAAAYGPTTLERVHDFEAEQAQRAGGAVLASASASDGRYVGHLDSPASAVTFTVDAPGPGTYPVSVYYANGSAAAATQRLSVDGDSARTVTYPPTPHWATFSDSQVVTVQVPLQAGANRLTLAAGTGSVQLDRIAANPYFDYQAIPAVQKHDDSDCCHWDGPSWPYETSQVLTGMANLLQDYPAQGYVTAADYVRLLHQFAVLQHRDGRPYVAEAANGDNGEWIYDASDFSENYNHSSFVDLVLTGLLGIKPQAGNTLRLEPLVPRTWDYYAVQNLPYHGHLLSIVWDRTGRHYHQGRGLRVYQDGKAIFSSPTLADTTFAVAPPVQPAPPTRLENVAANAWNADQQWLQSWDSRSYTPRYPEAFASYTNTTANGPRCRSNNHPRCVLNYDSPTWATDGWIRYDVTPDNRWTNKGSPNATDDLGVDFGAPRPVNEVTIYTYDNGADVRVPASYDVQYLGSGGWTSVPDQAHDPSRPAANAANRVTFTTVRTSRLRVVFTPQPGHYVGVTELESWYPQRPRVRIVNRKSGLDLGVTGASIDYGAGVEQETPEARANQLWQLEPAGAGYDKIVNVHSGLVLGISRRSTVAGALAEQRGDSLTPDQLWSVVDAGGGYSKLVNKNSGLVLGITDASTAAGAAALQSQDHGSDDTLWRLVPGAGTRPGAAPGRPGRSR